jgi:hypothetical protein
MKVCRDSYGSEIKYDWITVKFEESDLNDPLFGIGFTFHHLIVPLHLKSEFERSKRYYMIKPVLEAIKGGKIEYIDFKGKYREKQLRTLFD